MARDGAYQLSDEATGSLPGILRDPEWENEPQLGSLRRPVHIDSSTRVHVTTPNIPKELKSLIEDSPFKGRRWGSQLVGNNLLVPGDYAASLQSGGVVTAGLDEHLLLFGPLHWKHMETIVAQQLGLNPHVNDVMRHLYGRAEFFKPSFDEKGNMSIPISDELINYARLRKNEEQSVVIVGMVLWAEIHDRAGFESVKLSPSDIKSLAENFTKPLS